MHGLVNRAMQNFLCDTYGQSLWQRVVRAADLPGEGFEALLIYDDGLMDAMVQAAAVRLGKPRDALLEDFGIYLAGREGLRRLLRFGGADFVDFLYSLEDLADRVRLVVPDLILPDITLRHLPPHRFRLDFRGGHRCFQHVMCGVLHAMSDDYGALALVATAEAGEGAAVMIDLIEAGYAAARDFTLTLPEGA